MSLFPEYVSPMFATLKETSLQSVKIAKENENLRAALRRRRHPNGDSRH